MKSRTIAKILLCTLPVSFIQHGYSATNSMKITEAAISDQDKMALLQKKNLVDQQEILRNKYVQQLLVYSVREQLLANDKQIGGGKDDKDAYRLELCNRLSDALFQIGRFDPKSIGEDNLVPIYALDANAKDNNSLQKNGISELDRVSEKVIFNSLLDNILNMIFSGEIPLKEAAKAVPQMLLRGYLKASNIEDETKVSGKEAEALTKLEETVLKQRDNVVNLLSNIIKIGTINADTWKNFRGSIEFDNDGTTATLRISKDIEVYFHCNNPKLACESGPDSNECIGIERVIKTGKTTQERVDIKTGEASKEYLQKELNPGFFTRLLDSETLDLQTKDGKIKQIIAAYLELMYAMPERRMLIETAARKCNDGDKQYNDVEILLAMNDLYDEYNRICPSETKVRNILGWLVYAVYNFLEQITEGFKDIDFSKPNYNYSWLWDVLNKELISNVFTNLGVNFTREAGLDEDNKIPTFFMPEGNDITSLKESLEKEGMTLGDTLIIGGADVEEEGDNESVFVSAALTEFPCQLLVKGNVYCLAGVSIVENNGFLSSYLIPVKNIVEASLSAETSPLKAVMAMYKTMDSLGLAKDELHDMNSPVEEQKQSEEENVDMDYTVDNDNVEQIEEQYNEEQEQYVDNYNNGNEEQEEQYNEAQRQYENGEQNENEEYIGGDEEGNGEEGDGEEQYEEDDEE